MTKINSLAKFLLSKDSKKEKTIKSTGSYNSLLMFGRYMLAISWSYIFCFHKITYKVADQFTTCSICSSIR